MPGVSGVSGVTVVTTLVCFHFHRTQGCGRVERPAFPAPSDLRERRFRQNSRENARRDREAASLDRHAPLQAGHPVRRDLSYRPEASLEYWIARSCWATTPE